MKPRKFRQGWRVVFLEEVVHAFHKRQWLWLHGRPRHPSVIVSMTVKTVEDMIRRGQLYYADPLGETSPEAIII